MSSFENIKVGDKVLVKKEISYGWRNCLNFWILLPVERVTNAQFEIEGVMYWKKDGCQVGEPFNRVRFEGEESSFGDSPKDQREEYLKTVCKLAKYKEINKKIDEFQRISIPNLMESDQETFDKLSESLTPFSKATD